MLNEMRQVEPALWLAFYRMDPWDEGRADLRAGIIASTIANWAGRQLKENAKPVAPRDYMPYAQPSQEQLDEEISKSIRAAFLSRS